MNPELNAFKYFILQIIGYDLAVVKVRVREYSPTACTLLSHILQNFENITELALSSNIPFVRAKDWVRPPGNLIKMIDAYNRCDGNSYMEFSNSQQTLGYVTELSLFKTVNGLFMFSIERDKVSAHESGFRVERIGFNVIQNSHVLYQIGSILRAEREETLSGICRAGFWNDIFERFLIPADSTLITEI